ncbi:MAG: hypothetical protein QW052_06275 [Candidatus Nitrosocaldaceae archaeon]
MVKIEKQKVGETTYVYVVSEYGKKLIDIIRPTEESKDTGEAKDTEIEVKRRRKKQ